MKYLVMETHPSYAVLLDQSGRFLKAANLNYHVGDTVTDIIELSPVPDTGQKQLRLLRRITGSLTAAAACFLLLFFGVYRPNFTPYGTVRLQINPDIQMTLSKTERVLDLDALNPDGEALLEGYEYRGKDREQASEELVSRAMDMGYLGEGGIVSITVESDDSSWRQEEEEKSLSQMREKYGRTIIIRTGIMEGETEEPPLQTESDVEIIIDLPTPTPAPQTVTPTPAPVIIPSDDDDDDNEGVIQPGDDDDNGDDWEEVPGDNSGNVPDDDSEDGDDDDRDDDDDGDGDDDDD
ncbi:MAG TPA: hypothetical protein IAB71_09995 [Candidatus Scatomonas pullistercoris]|uniref:Anti-sigma factor RsgI-like middle domain-containing protein n=1 Tax=Candidatus Scatomonas pullistercoris TaxID=2840920 RepID=A0A9D1P3T0_9FIRM|nr:hypothetical protein [Candidatus Scatomonas pullistercoris]